ncbi:peroxisome assembly protein 12-like [Lineus longissimus]|uniref:peroxisome assembly protein 12-like n=1 Tax=Lineus longissimus TaxID=88925 RepID=UPI002B4EA205
MAEHGAHLTSGGSDTDNRPSIFEVLAQESLLSAVRPAVKHILRVVAEKNPSTYGFLYRFSDEFYAGLDLILQHHYLTKYSASFAENFYGLKRVSLEGGAKPDFGGQNESSGWLSRKAVKRSLFFLVVLPYVRLKLDSLYEEMKSRQEQYNLGAKSLKATFYQAFLGVYPYLHMVLEGAAFMFQLQYLLKKSEFHSPWLMLAGVKLHSLTEDDLRLQLERISGRTLLPTDSWSRRFRYWLSRGIGGVAILISNGLSVSVFFLQFLEWWYSSPGSPAVSLTALPVPDAPKRHDHGNNVCSQDTVCPLCGRIRTNETALSVSGYVFCYPCIYRHLEQHASCPVTGYPAKTEHLIRIYSQDS